MGYYINHTTVSFLKSMLRLVAGAVLIRSGMVYGSELFLIAGIAFVIAEILGIIEELV